MKHNSLFKNENRIQTIHKRETTGSGIYRCKLTKFVEENKFKKYERLELPADISEINDYFKSLMELNPCNHQKEYFSDAEKQQFYQNEELIVI